MSAMPAAPVALVVGDEMPSWRYGPVTRTDIVTYAGAGGDFNPIHHDEEHARRAGMPTVFAMGMLPAGVLGIRLARWVGPASVVRLSIRFIAQVWPGDELTLSGRVERVEGPHGHLALAVARQSGEAVLQASAVVLTASS
jgi:acyl dehydratase